MNKEAQNMEAIYKAKRQHDETCPWKGEGKRIYMTGFDIERMGWEEGDMIAGMKLLIDPDVVTGRFRIECDNEPQSKPEPEAEVEISEDVEVKDEDLVHA